MLYSNFSCHTDFLGLGKYLGTPIVQFVIGLLGGIVLIFFGANMIKDLYLGKISIDFNNNTKEKSGNMLICGALISASNPYFAVWWSAVGLGLIMNAFNMFGLLGVVLFYFGHIMADITWYVFISVLISKTRNFINLKAYKIIIALLCICLIGFGVSFIVSSIKIVCNYF